MISGVKWGSCLRKESLFHSACVVIWASSMAASAGLSHPLELSTSTHAWISRIACSTTIVCSVLDPPFGTQHIQTCLDQLDHLFNTSQTRPLTGTQHIHTCLDQLHCLFNNNHVQCISTSLHTWISWITGSKTIMYNALDSATSGNAVLDSATRWSSAQPHTPGSGNNNQVQCVRSNH